MIAFEDIYLSLAGRELYQGLSFQVGKEEKVALVGPSGAGKTTLLEMLTGFKKPERGQVIFQGEAVSPHSLGRIRQQISWLPQKPELGKMPVSEAIDFIFRLRANQHLPYKNRLEPALEELGLPAATLAKQTHELSGGERQRTGLVICALLERPVWLLDEPTSALDHDSVSRVKMFLQKRKITLLATSHNPGFYDVFDRLIKLEYRS